MISHTHLPFISKIFFPMGTQQFQIKFFNGVATSSYERLSVILCQPVDSMISSRVRVVTCAEIDINLEIWYTVGSTHHRQICLLHEPCIPDTWQSSCFLQETGGVRHLCCKWDTSTNKA